MKVFISWSGELSKQLGQALRDWLRPTLQSVEPYFSPTDIEKGQKWHNEISNKLEEIDFCIIAMTREALSSQWIVFEAGAISKRIDKSRICAICFDIAPSDIEGPLAPFQGMKWDREEIKSLVKQMNAASGEERLADAELQEIFDDRWPKLETKVSGILKSFVPSKKPPEVRTEREMIQEILLLVRGMQKDHLSETLQKIRNVFAGLDKAGLNWAVRVDPKEFDAVIGLLGSPGEKNSPNTPQESQESKVSRRDRPSTK